MKTALLRLNTLVVVMYNQVTLSFPTNRFKKFLKQLIHFFRDILNFWQCFITTFTQEQGERKELNLHQPKPQFGAFPFKLRSTRRPFRFHFKSYNFRYRSNFWLMCHFNKLTKN